MKVIHSNVPQAVELHSQFASTWRNRIITIENRDIVAIFFKTRQESEDV